MEENFILFLFVAVLALSCLLTRWFFTLVRPRLQHRKTTALICGNILILLFLISAIVLPGEIYFRYFYDGTDSFGLCKTTRRWFEEHFRRNNAGFRDSVAYRFELKPGVRRISFVGDSFTAGHGIPDVESRFGNRVRALRANEDVHVLAKCGWDTGHQIDFIRSFPVVGYKPDVVVLVYCLNDISDITPEWQEILARIYDAPQPGFLATHSFLFNTLHARLRMVQEPEVADYYSFVRRAYDGPVWSEQKARLKLFQELVEGSDGKLMVVTFPFLHALGDNYSYADIHRQLDDFWIQLGVPHLDLLSVYERNAPDELVVSPRDAHPNEHAHAMAATAISEFLNESLQQ